MGRVVAHQPVDQILHACAFLIFLGQGDADQAAGGGVHGRFAQLAGVHLAQTLEAGDVDLLALERGALQLGAVGVVAGVERLGADGQAIERRLRQIQMPAPDQIGHFLEEEGHQQRGDMRAVHVGVGHDDDLFVAQLGRVAILACAAAHGQRQVGDLLILQDLGRGGAGDVQDLAADRQDRLRLAIARLLGRAACRVALDD